MRVFYKHYKGGIYEFVCEAKLEADPNQVLVIYRSVDGQVWARPQNVFHEEIEFEGKKVKRFERISDVQSEALKLFIGKPGYVPEFPKSVLKCEKCDPFNCCKDKDINDYYLGPWFYGILALAVLICVGVFH